MSSKIHGFWSGVGSVLNLLPGTRLESTFLYKGHDLAKLTAEEALRQDWELVGVGMIGAVEAKSKSIASVKRKRSRGRQRRLTVNQ